MSIEEFSNTVLEQFLLRNPEKEAEIHPMTRNNGYVTYGLLVRKSSDNPVACVYRLNEKYEEYVEGEVTIEQLVEVLSTAAEQEAEQDFELSQLMEVLESEQFVDHVQMRLVNYERNKERIQSGELIYRLLEDTDLVFLFYLDITIPGGKGSIAIGKGVLEKANQKFTVEELYERCVRNMAEDKMVFVHINSIMERLLGGELSEIDRICSEPMYVLVSRDKLFGASFIVAEHVKEETREVFGECCVIALPSSIHEWIFIPMPKEEKDLCHIKSIVMEVNRTKVAEEEWLSDEIYSYNTVSGEFRLIDCKEVDSEWR